MAKLLVIGDLHCPCDHPGYMAFCQDLYEQWDCDRVHFIGDIADWQAISFHAKNPESPGPRDEYELAREGIQRWYQAFPKATVSIGNHDRRVIRLAESVGIPPSLLRPHSDIWDTPGWDWSDDHKIDGTYLFHGEGFAGQHPAFNAMRKMLMSVAMGHVHSAGGVKWLVNPERRIFGLDVGCGIDDKAAAFAYGRKFKVRSVLGAGVILDGVPIHEIMPMGPREKYHRSRFRASGSGRPRALSGRR